MPDSYDTLIAGQYAGDLQLLEQIGGQFYIGYDYQATNVPVTWTLRLGRYVGNYEHHPQDLHGYWIFQKGANRCWQAVGRGGGALDIWNKDGQAVGNPQDWELFTFQEVSKANSTVKILNSSYSSFEFAHTGEFPNDAPCYINLVNNTLSCNDSAENAAVFIVRFFQEDDPAGGKPNPAGHPHQLPHNPEQPPNIPGKPKKRRPDQREKF